jgi:excisionase family DNA binding protein
VRPLDAVTLEQAARILGCSRSTVRRYVLADRLPMHGSRYQHRTLSQSDVEALAAEVYLRRRYWRHEDSSWIVGQPAAAILGVTGARLRQLGDEDRVPYVVHRDGTRMYRQPPLP